MSQVILQPHWIMEYIRIIYKYAMCTMCNMTYEIFKTLELFTEHVVGEHNEIYESNICQGDPNWVWKLFYITENNYAKCILCNVMDQVSIVILEQIILHLMNKHHINIAHAIFYRSLTKAYFENINEFEGRCRFCGDIYMHSEVNSIILLNHLASHNIIINIYLQDVKS